MPRKSSASWRLAASAAAWGVNAWRTAIKETGSLRRARPASSETRRLVPIGRLLARKSKAATMATADGARLVRGDFSAPRRLSIAKLLRSAEDRCTP